MAITKDAIAKTVGEVKKASKKRNFVQSIDLTVNLKDFDPKKPENRLDEEIALPYGKGKDVKIAVIAEGELATQAKKAVDKVITKDKLEELSKDKKKIKKLANEYDFFIAQADLMPAVGRYLGPVLGPRGKMPKPVPANADIKPIANRLKKTVRVRTKEATMFHVIVGSETMEDEMIAENAETVLRFLERKLEKGFLNVKTVYMSTTMGPSIRLEV